MNRQYPSKDKRRKKKPGPTDMDLQTLFLSCSLDLTFYCP